MNNKLSFLMLLVIGLVSCSSEEQCPVDTIPGTYSGTYTEFYRYGDIEKDEIESLEVFLQDMNSATPQLVLGDVTDGLVFNIEIDGCKFSSEYIVEDCPVAFLVEGDFADGQLNIELINPITFPETEEALYGTVENAFESGVFDDLRGVEVLKAIDDLEGFDGFETLADINGIETLGSPDSVYGLIELFDELDYGSVSMAFSKI